MATTPTVELDTLYNETIESHEQYLAKLQEAFDKKCDEIGNLAKAKMDGVPEEDQETRQKILEEEDAQLGQALAELKQVVKKANADALKKLEEIENQRTASQLNLEAELAQIENPKK